MSRVTKNKHVMREMFADDFRHPSKNQEIVRIVSSPGNNLHVVESSVVDNTNNFLVTMPTKFRHNIWVKRGNFVVIEPIDEGDKVKGEIVKILNQQYIKEYQKDGIWPKKFDYINNNKRKEIQQDSDADDDDEFVFKNLNRYLPHEINNKNADDDDNDNDDDDDDDEDEDDDTTDDSDSDTEKEYYIK